MALSSKNNNLDSECSATAARDVLAPGRYFADWRTRIRAYPRGAMGRVEKAMAR